MTAKLPAGTQRHYAAFSDIERARMIRELRTLYQRGKLDMKPFTIWRAVLELWGVPVERVTAS